MLFDLCYDPRTPQRAKLLLFDAYISAKWLWAAPVMWPTQRLLRRVAALQNTFLMGPLGLACDYTLGWLADEMVRRRAVKETCLRLQGTDWARTWVLRLWGYWGHVSRSTQDLPIVHMFRTCHFAAVATGSVRASWVQETIPRKLQRAYGGFRRASWAHAWELLAFRRSEWTAAAEIWAHWWVPRKPRDHPDSFAYRQLVVVQDGVVSLRPSRSPPEEPYRRTTIHVSRYNHAEGEQGWVLWVSEQAGVVTVDIAPPKAPLSQHTWMQANQPARSSAMHTQVDKWAFVYKCRQTLHYATDVTVVVPSAWFMRCMLQQTASLVDWTHVMHFARLDTQVPRLLEECRTYPKKIPKVFQAALTCGPQTFPAGMNHLLRDPSGLNAQFFR